MNAARNFTRAVAIASLLCLKQAAAADAPVVELAAARATDPVAMQWMVGFPPPPDKQIRFDDGSYFRFPQLRWSFSHWRELRPTTGVSRGSVAPRPLPRAELKNLDTVTFLPMGSQKPMTWADSLIANYTDGIVILHRGRIVYERYFGALQSDGQHAAFSVTKSLFGTLAAMLIAEGRIDPQARVSRYLPELASSAFGDATVVQVLDMTTALDYVENYTGESPSTNRYRYSSGYIPRPADYTGPATIHTFLPTIEKKGTHGTEFHYRTPNVDVISWIIARVTGQSPAALLSERIWSRLGAEDDAYIQVDSLGTPLTGAALSAKLRDLARFGELMRLDGKLGGQQIISKAAMESIKRGGDRQAFVAGGYTTLPGWSYHDFWWVSHDDHGVYMARGIHGQAIYIDPKAEMVIARFASHPSAGNTNIDPLSLPAYRAIAEHLIEAR